MWEGPVHFGGSPLGLVTLASKIKQAEQDTRNKSVKSTLLESLHPLLLPGSCLTLDCFGWWTVGWKCEWKKPLPPPTPASCCWPWYFIPVTITKTMNGNHSHFPLLVAAKVSWSFTHVQKGWYSTVSTRDLWPETGNEMRKDRQHTHSHFPSPNQFC